MPNAVTELKIAMKQALYNLAQSGNASNSNVIKYLRQNHSDLIKNSRAELEDIALRRISNDLVSSKNNTFANSEVDLFGNKNGLKPLYSIREGKGKKRLPLGVIKLSVLIRSLEDQDAARVKENKNRKTIDYLKELSDRAGSDDLTYDEAMKALSSSK